MLSFMHEADPYGYLTLNGRDVGLEALARMVGSPLKEVRQYLGELEAAGVFSRTETGTIYSRRMVRDEALRLKRGQYGHLALQNPAVPRKKDTDKDTFKDTLSLSIGESFGGSPSSSSSSSSSLEEKKEKRAGSASPSPANGTSRKRNIQLADGEFIARLKANPAYAGIDIEREIGKCRAWLLTPKGRGKQLTRQRVVNWLNGVDVPINGHGEVTCTKRIQPPGEQLLRECGEPADPRSRPIEPRCAAHLAPVMSLNGAATC